MTWARKVFENIISKNPQTDKVDDLGGTQELRSFEDDDAIVTQKISRRVANHCGCFGEPGGRCSEEGCGVISCVNCHKHCGGTNPQHPAGCGVSLCRKHAHYLTLPDGTVVPLCKSCFGKFSRKQLSQAVRKAFLQLFAPSEEYL
jgi:hypothetical protein